MQPPDCQVNRNAAQVVRTGFRRDPHRRLFRGCVADPAAAARVGEHDRRSCLNPHGLADRHRVLSVLDAGAAPDYPAKVMWAFPPAVSCGFVNANTLFF